MVSGAGFSDGSPGGWGRRSLDAEPAVLGLAPGRTIGVQVVEDEIGLIGANHHHEMMLARRHDDLGQQQGARQSPAGQEFVALGHRVIIAIARRGRDQPFLADDARQITLGLYRRLTSELTAMRSAQRRSVGASSPPRTSHSAGYCMQWRL
jgi:hypothetical protein